jgi:hypothetical protein
MKRCPKCKQTLNDADFYEKTRNCKKCHLENMKDYHSRNKEKVALINRKHKLMRNYGITIQQYEYLLKEQNSKCAICGTSEIKRSKAKYFNVDHNHKTGKIRGLLCHDCNVLLGKLSDNIEICKKVIEYLSK